MLCSVTFFENRAVYEIMWKNILYPVRPQMTKWRMCTACLIHKATNTHLQCARRFFSTATMVARTCLSVTFYVHCLSCLLFKTFCLNHCSHCYTAFVRKYFPSYVVSTTVDGLETTYDITSGDDCPQSIKTSVQ
jgi:hypothetical protein